MSNFVATGVPSEVANLASSIATFPPSGSIVVLAGDLGNTATSPQVIATHLTNPLPVAQGGSGVATSTGTVAVVLSNTPTLVTPVLGAATGTSLNLGATGVLSTTATSGSGSLAMTTSPVFTTPSLGVASASGIGINGSAGSAGVVNGATGWVIQASGTGLLTFNTTSVELNQNLIFDATKSITQYNGIATVSNGVPSEFAQINTTGLTANVSVATLYAVPSTGAGIYRISTYVVETTAGSVTSTLPNAQIVYTDKDTSGSITMDCTPVLGVAGIGQTGALTANTIGTASSGVVVISAKASTTIQYQTVNYASNAAGMAYSIYIRLEAL